MGIAERDFSKYLERLLAGDHRGCCALVQRLLAEETPIKELYVHLFQPALYRVGDLWEQHRVSVAAEHLATTITESVLSLSYPRLFATPRVGKRAVVSCVGGEFHQIGARMVADIFELHGWDSFFLGANTPSDELLKLLREKPPDVLALSVCLRGNIGIFRELLYKTRACFPVLEILVGGQGVRADEIGISGGPHLLCLWSLDELETWIAHQ